ncbi:MAG: hypothetical protein ABIP55_06540 [Tepidisphaeraceae bacterium]
MTSDPSMDFGGEHVILLILACAALLVRTGLAWASAGLSRAKFAASAVVRSAADLAVAVLAFWAVGSAIQNRQWGQLFDANNAAGATQFLQLILVLIATAPVAGAIGERCRFLPALLAPAVLGGLIVPLCARWAWNGGWLQRIGFFDVAGASVLHVTGGLFAAAGAICVGPRNGKYNRDGSSNMIPGHSVPMASVGVMLMLVGWIPYVLAASAMNATAGPKTAMNVLLAASSGTIVAILISRARYGKVDIMLTYGGLLGGLVAISASGGVVHSISAVIIGAVAGLLVPTATVIIDLVWKIDDPAGGVAIHAVGGAWGTIAVGVFAPAAGIGDRIRHLGVQSIGLVLMGAVALAASLALFAALKKTVGLRLNDNAEYDGADLAEHDLNAYPDFQQTMIKSYHLREA